MTSAEPDLPATRVNAHTRELTEGELTEWFGAIDRALAGRRYAGHGRFPLTAAQRRSMASFARERGSA